MKLEERGTEKKSEFVPLPVYTILTPQKRLDDMAVHFLTFMGRQSTAASPCSYDTVAVPPPQIKTLVDTAVYFKLDPTRYLTSMPV